MAPSSCPASTTTSSPPTREERFEISCLPFDEDDFQRVDRRARARRRRARLHAAGVHGPSARRWTSTGIWGGFTGEGSKTIIPAHAHAKVSCRLVPDQDGDKLFAQFRDYVLQVAPKGVTVEVQNLGTAKAAAHGPENARLAGRGAGAQGDVRRRRPCSSARAAASRSRAMFESILGLPVIDARLHEPR